MSYKILEGVFRRIFLMFVFVYGGSSLHVNAADQNPDSHEHGAGAVHIVFESSEIEIELEVPAEDIVGFETKPITKAEKESVKKGVSMLQRGGQIFVFPKGAGCILGDVSVTSALIEEGNDTHKHEDEHSHGDHKSEDKHQETHSEFLATYHFNCQNISEVNQIFIEFFKLFSSTEKLRVQFVTHNGQGSATVTPNATKITFN